MQEPTITEEHARAMTLLIASNFCINGPIEVRLVAPNTLQTFQPDGTAWGLPKSAPDFVRCFLAATIRRSNSERMRLVREELYSWIRSVEGEVSR